MSTAPPPADDTPRRRWLRRRAAPASPDAPAEGAVEDAPEAAAPAVAGDAPPAEVVPAPPRTEGPRQLRRRREQLLTEREETVYHLGGLAFELYRRDRLSDEVMRLRAGHVAQIDDAVRDIDAQLSDAERERRERKVREPADPSVGCCLICRTPFRAEARFCWQCGAQLVPQTVGDEQPTAAIPIPPPA
ncbi:MAG TPA: hypothetical protein VL422_17655 [Miltoncostaea sp.]|nr:hypothetical protein [Miltoncostaea sp.]